MRNGYIRRLHVRLKAVFIKMAGRLSVSSWRMNICMLVRQWIRGVIRRINISLQDVMERTYGAASPYCGKCGYETDVLHGDCLGKAAVPAQGTLPMLAGYAYTPWIPNQPPSGEYLFRDLHLNPAEELDYDSKRYQRPIANLPAECRLVIMPALWSMQTV